MESTNAPYIRKNGDWIDVFVKVTPKSKRERIGDVVESGQGERLEMWVNAPPVDGKANQAVVQLLAKTLKVATSQCEVHQGHSSRYKTLRLPYNENTYNALVALWPIKRPQQSNLF